MSDLASSRLRGLGVLVILACLFLLLVKPITGVELELSEALSGIAALGVGLMLLAEIGPFVKTLKAGGVEVDFVETVSDRFGAMEQRVAELERAGAGGSRSLTPAPALSRKTAFPDDPQKGRFGGKASDKGFTLSARFRSSGSDWVDVRLLVEADQGVTLKPEDYAEFFLHDTFDPDQISAVFKDGRAELSVLSYGGFTVGVWIPSHGVQLELDLARVRGAPRAIRDL